MTNRFSNPDPELLESNIFKMLNKQWMLVTAGQLNNYNMMTASWGGFGILWNKKVAFVFIRPQRYTFEFSENNDLITLSFFPENFREILTLLGTKSGREINKKNIEGLTAFQTPEGATAFNEAELIFTGKKLYFDDIKPENFIQSDLIKNYPINDFHRMYIFEILNAYVKK